ncbi:MAG: thioredoxin family protein [Alphaproteobacteria bacterium]|nr:thioredoxin family protein [Alphaproteobacteria bacterium]
MKRLMMIVALVLFNLPVLAAPEIGQPAPDFTIKDIDGKEFNLADHKGKVIVLEWTNHECPFVRKHYESGNMQKTQQAARDQGVEWVSIVSSAPGRQGHVGADEARKIAQENKAVITTKLLDESGEIGKAYAAQTTPHMFVINKDGVLAYMGAIDDQPSPRAETVEGAQNYVLAALADLSAGKPVTTAQTQPYGCAVKYGE